MVFRFGSQRLPFLSEVLDALSVSMPPTVLNENLISRYKSLAAPLYAEPAKEGEAGSLNLFFD